MRHILLRGLENKSYEERRLWVHLNSLGELACVPTFSPRLRDIRQNT